MAKELEWKGMVTPAEFDRCLQLLRAHTGTQGDAYVQVNYYFDTPDFAVAQSRSMLRVRRKKNTLRLQFKTKRTRTGGMLLCDESETVLKKLPRSVCPSLYFADAPQGECYLLGDLVTHRTDFTFPGAVVSLDESIYLGKSDYEIEVEGEAQAIEGVLAFLNPQGESKKGNGKFSRFLKAYRKYTRPATEKE
ncbi:MAG: CYTH domain-containing protein [Clostridia bacterium]|nr:CYTH domain-containing protein [Clostridia bacterium]MBQ2273742.1 CYTH domain-containing protein [Clostridia bacterium]MBQ5820335.1 CYTH domain-containing protein [Clostridia bacterium]